jgi:mannose-6-phosphate isomerase-like protein (cupin superfamily)
MMTLQPGQASGELGNEHPRAEQWLFVVKGHGVAIGKRSRLRLRQGSLLWIRRNETHQIRNTGRSPLVTLNFYAPSAYTPSGDVRSSVKR